MSYYTQPYYQSTPINVPTKGQSYDEAQSYLQPTGRVYGVSPPEAAESVSTGSGVPSYGNSSYSAASSNYAGSTSEFDSTCGSGVDLHEYMQDRFSNAFDPLPLDRSLVTQAQTSGKLNAKQREILELQAKAQARLAKSRARFAEGMQDAKEVKRDLEWTQKRVTALKTKASRKHPKEYKKAHDRYPSPEY